MAASRLLPSNEVEVTKITEFVAMALRDRRRRVRHAVLETLATLAQLSSNTEVLDVVTRTTSTFQDQQYLLRVIRARYDIKSCQFILRDIINFRFRRTNTNNKIRGLYDKNLALKSKNLFFVKFYLFFDLNLISVGYSY